jgi:uncharacterized protein
MRKKQLGVQLIVFLSIILLVTGCSNALPSNQVEVTKETEKTDEQNSNKKITGDPVKLKIATLTQGGAWYVYGATMAELLRQKMPEGSVFDVLPYAGGIGNPQMVAEKQSELGLSFSITNKWASEGTVAFDKQYDSIRALAGSLDKYYVGIMLRKDFAEEYGIESLEDLKEKKAPVKLMTINVGSLGELATRQVLDQYGLSYESIEDNGGSVQHTTFDVIKQAFQDNRADMMIQVITEGHASFTEIAIGTPVKFMSIDNNAKEKLNGIGYEAAELPAGVFEGQDEPVQTVGFSTVLIANKDLSEDLAYQITKLISENKPALVAGHKALESYNPENAWKPGKLGIPLHPGAEKYYKEKGWLK